VETSATAKPNLPRSTRAHSEGSRVSSPSRACTPPDARSPPASLSLTLSLSHTHTVKLPELLPYETMSEGMVKGLEKKIASILAYLLKHEKDLFMDKYDAAQA
jgi:hypothetical protein